MCGGGYTYPPVPPHPSRSVREAQEELAKLANQANNGRRPAANDADVPAQNTRSKGSRVAKTTNRAIAPKPTAGRSSKTGKGDGKDDKDDKDADKNGKGSTKPNRVHVSKKVKRPCDFCTHDPVGEVMHANRKCDWHLFNSTIGWECLNCADHRQTAGAGDHACTVVGTPLTIYRKYHTSAPTTYSTPACDECLLKGGPTSFAATTCDVDAILGIACSNCKDGKCHIKTAETMKRPKLRQGYKPWWRHSCDGCLQKYNEGRVKEGPTTKITGCSWLHDRTSWDRACGQCMTKQLACLRSATVVALPASTVNPSTWKVIQRESAPSTESRLQTEWRKKCSNCPMADDASCLAYHSHPGNACSRCESWGVSCEAEQDDTMKDFPMRSLANVGFGSMAPFKACFQCLLKGRNCDRQRPCDSCDASGEGHKCDPFRMSTAAAERVINGRRALGPLYYLSLGYGATGVTDVKDGTKLEHWVGPARPSLTFGGTKGENLHTRARIAGAIQKQRNDFLPPGAPPYGVPAHATQHGNFLGITRAERLTVQDIVNEILRQWPGAVPPAQFDNQRWRASLQPPDVHLKTGAELQQEQKAMRDAFDKEQAEERAQLAQLAPIVTSSQLLLPSTNPVPPQSVPAVAPFGGHVGSTMLTSGYVPPSANPPPPRLLPANVDPNLGQTSANVNPQPVQPGLPTAVDPNASAFAEEERAVAEFVFEPAALPHEYAASMQQLRSIVELNRVQTDPYANPAAQPNDGAPIPSIENDDGDVEMEDAPIYQSPLQFQVHNLAPPTSPTGIEDDPNYGEMVSFDEFMAPEED